MSPARAPRLAHSVLAAAVAASLVGCEASSGDVIPASRRQPDDFAARAAGESLPTSVLEEMKVLAEHKRDATPAQRKLATALRLEVDKRNPASAIARLPKLESRVRVDADDRTRVDIEARVTPRLERRLHELGATVLSGAAHHGRLRALVPVGALERLASDPDVRQVRPAFDPVTRKDDTSEGDEAHRADVVRQELGLDGSGVSIGVVSDGVDAMGQVLASEDLSPDAVPQIIPGQAGTGSEGTAMLEIVYDLAPGASLWFATAGESQQQMADNIRALADVGCDIIVDDVFFLDEATFQDDAVAKAVLDVVAQGVVFFSASGNSGNLAKGTSGTYEGDYVGVASLPTPVSDYPMGEWSDVHEFEDGANFDTILWDPPTLVSLEWADPLDGAANDYDLFLLSPDRQNIVSAGLDPQDGTTDAFEFVLSDYSDDTYNTLVVARWTGDARYLRLSTHRGMLEIATAGQISGHSAVPGSFSISAVDANVSGGVFRGGASNPVENFVSDGPRRMFFDRDGAALTPGNFLASGGAVRLLPDFSAADGVSTATPGFNPFYGTSAAAPHAAAIAALVLQARPDIMALEGIARPNAIRQLFLESALDIEADGFDDISGYGLIMADAVGAGCAGLEDGAPCDDFDSCTESSQCESGTCIGTPVICPAIDECHSAGQCNPTTGECSAPEQPDGTPCDDADACSPDSSCVAGVCLAETLILCAGEDACYEAAACDAATGMCVPGERKSDDSGCDDDEDGVANGGDVCPELADADQLDTDGDGSGDACDEDDDGDGLDDEEELGEGSDPLDANDPGDSASGGAGSGGAGAQDPTAGAGGAGVAGGGSGGTNGMGGADSEPEPEEPIGTAGAGDDDPGAGGAEPLEPSKFGGAPASDPDEEDPGSLLNSEDAGATPSAVESEKPGGQTGDSGCGCRVQQSPSTGALAALGLLVLALGRRSRRFS